jgi:hypothetical protein
MSYLKQVDKKSSKKVGAMRSVKKAAPKFSAKAAAKAPKFEPLPPGYRLQNNLYVPGTIVQASALKKGFESAKKEIRAMVDEIAGIMNNDYKIGEIELMVSFSADGKFMGFGVGGATSMKIKIVPYQ